MPSQASPAFAVDRQSAVPLFRQIYQRVRAAITDGRLQPGERLPSARTLAAQLGVARGTIEAAYAMLSGEGWVVARGAGGTVVTGQLVNPQPRPVPAPLVRSAASPFNIAGSPPFFHMGLPALDAFPRKLWARLVVREARSISARQLGFPDAAGDAALRQAIATYLAISRGVACAPDQVFVTAGFQGALSLIARVLIKPGTRVFFEDPGYGMSRRGLIAAGARLVPVPVDGEGMRVADAVADPEGAGLAVVTPAHHSPLGVTLSLPRRLALLAWAEASGAWIVEDDYDGEFRYAGRPLPALKSLDRADVVLYAGTFSKVLFPALRLGYLVVPDRLVDRFAEAVTSFSAGCGRFEQAVVASFMAEGHFARHLKRMRGLYTSRRAALAAALTEVFGDRLTVELGAGGMHLVAQPTNNISDLKLVRLAERRGLALTLAAVSDHTIRAEAEPGLLLSFTNIPETSAVAACRMLEAAIGDHLRDHRPNWAPAD